MDYYPLKTLKELHWRDSENPITGKSIADILGLRYRSSGKEGADVRAIIHNLKIGEYPIVATDKGYFYAHTKADLSDYIRRLSDRIEEQQKTVDGLKKSFKNIGVSIKEIEEREKEKELKGLSQTLL